ncbi:enoyl-CoA hydratase/isomerase family protein [Neorhizobium petrolearium]|uniref:enoyl-CoA hydratase/isomerase family protein n=1 Tax=Neorhizobium petrolearium TaxID=515361 RepID=UPI003F176DC5
MPKADFKTLLLEADGPVWKILINRPDVRNAHDLETFKELVAAFDLVENDPDCRCAILSGVGDVFSAGQDIGFTRSAGAAELDAYGRWNVAARQRIQRNFKPVIAAVNGPAIGGGCYLAAACDLIVAVDTAFFQMREIQAGNHSGGAFLFTIGRARSLEMSLLGRRVPAQQAEEWGLINACVPAEEFEAAVEDYAQELAQVPPLAVRYTKAATNILLDSAGFSAHLDAGAPMQRYLALTPDGREAKAAFKERRKPRFTGAYPAARD